MSKKSIKTFMKILFSVLLCFPFVFVLACGVKNDPNVLNVVCYEGGYGSDWIHAIADIFEKENNGYKVKITASKNAPTTIKTNMAKKNNIDDLYISIGIDWQSYAPQGKIINLDDFYNDTVDGVLIKDKLNSAYSESVKTTKAGEEHYFRTPWIAGVGGLFYNVDMFATNHWEIPTTYEELTELCSRIIRENVPVVGSDEDTVKPFVFTGGEAYYWDYTVFNWWGQITGNTDIQEFLKYKSAKNFDTSNAIEGKAYSGLKQAYSLWYDLVAKNSQFCMNDCTGKSYNAAQNDFVSGKVAMMPNGQWLYNEMKEVAPNFKMALMPTPLAPNATHGGTSYLIGNDQSMVIPSSSTKQDLAKKFLKIIASNQGCDIFLRKSNGILAFNGDFDLTDTTLTPFQKSILAVQSADKTLFTDYSNAKISKAKLIGFWGGSACAYNASVNGYDSSNPTTSESNPTKVFDSIKKVVDDQWDIWQAKVS